MYRSSMIRTHIKLTLILGTLLTVVHQWSALLAGDMVQWIPTLTSYVIIYCSLYALERYQRSHTDEPLTDEPLGTVSSQDISALYKQAMIVERNAHKANAAFTNQLKTIRSLIERTKAVKTSKHFDEVHGELVTELKEIEKRIANIVKEMEKNVKLGEKLQQSVANIDPEIGVL